MRTESKKAFLIKNKKQIIMILIIIVSSLLFISLNKILYQKNPKNNNLVRASINHTTGVTQVTNPYDFSKSERIIMQTHCHSNLGSGTDTPQQLIEKYRDLGYRALAITDHDSITWPWPISPPLMVPFKGNEISGSWHMSSLSNDYLKGSETNPQIWINEINNRDGISIINHPARSGKSCNDLKGLTGYSGIEIYNYRSSGSIHYSLTLWDCLLSSGRRNVLGVASDDYHGGAENIDRGKIVVLANTLTEQEVKAAIKSGNFYSVVGTGNMLSFQNISVSNLTLSVTTNIPSDIIFIGNNGATLKSVNNQTVANYNISGNENYIRIEARSGNSEIYSNPISVDQAIYSWQFISQTADRNLAGLSPGEQATITLTAKNTGNTTWLRTGSNPVRVGTTNPRDRMSTFANGSWLGPNRPVGLPVGTDSVAPGATVTFTWTYTAPARAGTYREYFSLVTEGITWMNNPGVNYYTVVNGTYSWQFISQSASKSLVGLSPGETVTITLTAKNTGDTIWYRTGSNPVRVGTTNPRDRSSTFANGTWLGANRPVGLPDGTNSVAPNATVTFTWTYTAPARAGTYSEHFSLVTEGITWMNDPGVNYYTVVN